MIVHSGVKEASLKQKKKDHRLPLVNKDRCIDRLLRSFLPNGNALFIYLAHNNSYIAVLMYFI